MDKKEKIALIMFYSLATVNGVFLLAMCLTSELISGKYVLTEYVQYNTLLCISVLFVTLIFSFSYINLSNIYCGSKKKGSE